MEICPPSRKLDRNILFSLTVWAWASLPVYGWNLSAMWKRAQSPSLEMWHDFAPSWPVFAKSQRRYSHLINLCSFWMTRHRPGYKSTAHVRAHRQKKQLLIADPESFRPAGLYKAAQTLRQMKMRSSPIAILKSLLTPDQCEEIRTFGLKNAILEPRPIDFRGLIF